MYMYQSMPCCCVLELCEGFSVLADQPWLIARNFDIQCRRKAFVLPSPVEIPKEEEMKMQHTKKTQISLDK